MFVRPSCVAERVVAVEWSTSASDFSTARCAGSRAAIHQQTPQSIDHTTAFCGNRKHPPSLPELSVTDLRQPASPTCAASRLTKRPTPWCVHALAERWLDGSMRPVRKAFWAGAIILVATGGMASGPDSCGSDGISIELYVCAQLPCKPVAFSESACGSALTTACTSSDSDALTAFSLCEPTMPCGTLTACTPDSGLSASCSAELRNQVMLGLHDGGA